MMRFNLIILMICGLFTCKSIVGEENSGEPLSLCSLVENIEKYNGKRVKLKAFYRGGPANSILYDPACRDGEPLVFVEIMNGAGGEIKKAQDIIIRNGFAYLILEGIVHGPEPILPDPHLPAWINELYKDSVKGYGHSNAYQYQIDVYCVIDAKAGPNQDAQ